MHVLLHGPSMADTKKIPLLKVLLLPWLSHEHISPFLDLATTLSARNFHVYMCSTPANLISIQDKITTSIELVELRLQSSPELPPSRHTTSGLPPHLIAQLKKAYENSAPEFSSIISSLQPDLVVYDLNQPWAAEIASGKRIPAIQFISVSAAFVSFCLHAAKSSGEKFPYPEIYLRDYERLCKLQGSNDVNGGKVFFQALDLSHKILLIKSHGEIEGKFIDFLSSVSGKSVVPTGPLVQEPSSDGDRKEDEETMAWLDRKKQGSAVYASFGSEYFLSKDEIEVISRALELSGVDFLWALGFPPGEKTRVREALPEGFLERTKNRGMVVGGCAPQAKILKHSGSGAFLSHCGWSSVMESVKWGVPIVAVPMHIDQPLNARLVEAAGVGVEAVRDEKGDLRSEEIARVIRRVVVEESGEEVKRKVKEMSEKMERGDEEIDALVEELLRLCQNYRA